MVGQLKCGLLVLAQVLLVSSAQAACSYFDSFKDNGNGTVTDPRSGLVWQKCAIGQTWKGNTCAGDATTMDWATATQTAKANRFLKQSNWRLPTKEELIGVAGDHDQCLAGRRAASASLAYPVTGDGYLGVYWSSTLNKASESGAWDVSFLNGYVGVNFRYSNYNVRLVSK